MTEWLSQYEKVAQRQQQYLQKIRDLRQRLQTKDERYMMLSIERMRKLPLDADPYHRRSLEHKSHVPWSSSLLAHSFYPKMSTPSPRLSMRDSPEERAGSERGASYSCFISGERLHPKAQPPKPRRLDPLNSKPSKERAEKASKSDIVLERNKTDYEPIEDIAKRNRIQFSRYLSSPDGKDDRDKTGNCGKRGRPDLSGNLSVVANAGDDEAQRNV